MSALIESGRKPAGTASLPLLVRDDAQRVLAWRDGRPVGASSFLGEAIALAARLPAAGYAVNLCADRYQFLLSFCAVALAGQTNLLPPSRTPQAIAETLHAYPASYALCESPLAQPLRQFVMPAELAAASCEGIPEIPATQVVAIAFTSGSTGQPKANAKTWSAFRASTALNATLLCGNGAANVVATVPPQHMYGLELSVLLPLLSAASIHCGQPFFPADIAHALHEVPAPRMLVTTPVHLRALLRAAPALPPLQAVVSATAPLDAELAAQVECTYATRVIELFGSTETCVIAHRLAAQGGAWQLYPHIRLHPQPDGTLVEAPQFVAPTLLQDIVELLPDARFHLCGRNSDLLEIAGKRASLGDLTRRLLAVPGIEDGVVFTLDADQRGVHRLAALVVAPTLSEAQILTALRAAIDPVFLPRPLRRVPSLPRNATGKLPRTALLEMLEKAR